MQNVNVKTISVHKESTDVMSYSVKNLQYLLRLYCTSKHMFPKYMFPNYCGMFPKCILVEFT